MVAAREQLSVSVPTPLRIRAGDGLVLAAQRHGPDPAPGHSVLLAHGFGQTAGAWSATAARLAAHGHAAIAADARGHGASGWNPPGQPYTLPQFLGDVHALAAATAAAPAWVGASMGGLLGLIAAGEADAPLFSALVLVDITPRWERQGVDRILRFMGAHPEGFTSLGQAAEAIARYLPHRPRKSPAQLAELLVRHDDGRWRWHWDPRLLDEMAPEAEAWQSRLAAAARRLAIPTLLISGGRSDLVSQHTVDEFLALAPHAEHVRIADATHMVAGDRNDAFADALFDFLARRLDGAATDHGAPR